MSKRIILALSLITVVTAWIHPIEANGAISRVVATGLKNFGIEEPAEIYYPFTQTFADDSYKNIVDQGNGIIRETLRYYKDGANPENDWWDGDRTTGNDDRQRAEIKNLGGSKYYQKNNETYEYSYDFRTNPEFVGTSHFCHIFQLKARDEANVGSSGSPLVTLSLYKRQGITQGVLQYSSGDTSGFTQARTFTFTPGQWIHAVIRITTTTSNETTGSVMASINGDSFQGVSGVSIYRPGATQYYNKWGFYRGIGVDYGVPAGDSWIEDRNVTLMKGGTTSSLIWNGGSNFNAWNVNAASNWLSGPSTKSFSNYDQVRFDDSSKTNTVNIVSAVSPGYVHVENTKDFTFSGIGKISGTGTLSKKGPGKLMLATTNDYSGPTSVEDGTMIVTGSVGNNSPVLIYGGTLRAGSSAALGTNSNIGTLITGGTLDINGMNLSTERITVQGAGVGGNGAIVNSGNQQDFALADVTLSGDTTFGGGGLNPPDINNYGRWDIRGAGATLNTRGKSYNLTKVGSNYVALIDANVDPALGNIDIKQGILGFQMTTSSMGDPAKTVNVASGAALNFYNTVETMNKMAVLNGGAIWAERGADNTFGGSITVDSGGIFDAGGALSGGSNTSPAAALTLTGDITGSGGITKSGPGTVFLRGSTINYDGDTIINEGIMKIDSGLSASVILHAVTGAGNLWIDNTTTVIADSINVGMLIVGKGSKIVLAPLAGKALFNQWSLTPVPEPSSTAMLLTAGLMGLLIVLRRRSS